MWQWWRGRFWQGIVKKISRIIFVPWKINWENQPLKWCSPVDEWTAYRIRNRIFFRLHHVLERDTPIKLINKVSSFPLKKWNERRKFWRRTERKGNQCPGKNSTKCNVMKLLEQRSKKWGKSQFFTSLFWILFLLPWKCANFNYITRQNQRI